MQKLKMDVHMKRNEFKITESQAKAISLLVHLLKNNGDKILNGSTKLSLTTSIIHVINEGFEQVIDEDLERSFHVQQPTHFTNSVFQDLICLYDFVQKTVSLKITHGITTLQHNVDIKQFRALKVLEIKKIPVHMLIGLEGLRNRLTIVICCRCLNRLQDFFEVCGADRAEPFPWPKLTVLILSYNNIENLDRSLFLLPNLEVLDLSHNNINNTKEIERLHKLKYLNLSYNYLETIPVLGNDCCASLKSLILRNNNFDDLNGFPQFDCLEELDLANNCLVYHIVLQPLQTLKSLKSLHLEGNPLSFHEKHRQVTLFFLHPDVLSTQFQLDGQHVLPKELVSDLKETP